jgi:hypothetical protein
MVFMGMKLINTIRDIIQEQDSTTVSTTSRKGRANWSPEAEQDLYAFHPELKKDLSLEEQDFVEEDYSIRDTFTAQDRRMLHAIYDVLVKGGSGGGYKGSRKRPIAPLGYLTPTGE